MTGAPNLSSRNRIFRRCSVLGRSAACLFFRPLICSRLAIHSVKSIPGVSRKGIGICYKRGEANNASLATTCDARDPRRVAWTRRERAHERDGASPSDARWVPRGVALGRDRGGFVPRLVGRRGDARVRPLRRGRPGGRRRVRHRRGGRSRRGGGAPRRPRGGSPATARGGTPAGAVGGARAREADRGKDSRTCAREGRADRAAARGRGCAREGCRADPVA